MNPIQIKPIKAGQAVPIPAWTPATELRVYAGETLLVSGSDYLLSPKAGGAELRFNRAYPDGVSIEYAGVSEGARRNLQEQLAAMEQMASRLGHTKATNLASAEELKRLERELRENKRREQALQEELKRQIQAGNLSSRELAERLQAQFQERMRRMDEAQESFEEQIVTTVSRIMEIVTGAMGELAEGGGIIRARTETPVAPSSPVTIPIVSGIAVLDKSPTMAILDATLLLEPEFAPIDGVIQPVFSRERVRAFEAALGEAGFSDLGIFDGESVDIGRLAAFWQTAALFNYRTLDRRTRGSGSEGEGEAAIEESIADIRDAPASKPSPSLVGPADAALAIE